MSSALKTLDHVKETAIKAGRKYEDITVVAISKKQPVEKIIDISRLGIKNFGENRVQEFVDKFDIIQQDIAWHFVGHLQTNKIKYIIGKTDLIHSIDSLNLAQALSQKSLNTHIVTRILLQLNVSGEESKFGFSDSQLESTWEELIALPGIKICGFMTMAPYTDDIKIISHCFSDLRKTFEKYKLINTARTKLEYLSMGMSNDYEIAINEGANLLRLGTVLFGPRN